MPTRKPDIPEGGATITIDSGRLRVPDHPIMPFLEGGGTGPDIWRASVRVFNAAVEKAYGARRRIHWLEVLRRGEGLQTLRSWLPDETVKTFRE